MTRLPSPDNVAAIDFLRKMYPEGPWVLTAIRTERKAIDTRTFYPKTEAALLDWLKQYNGERNIYWSVNAPLRDLSKKAEREDIKEVCYLHVDVDPRAGEPLETERPRIEAMFTTQLAPGLPEPTALVFSGGGYQAFWKLETPIPISGDIARAEDAKRYNQHLELIFGGDNCHNIDRIMRLPGTINVPDAKKLKKGRKTELATLTWFEAARVYPLSAFTPLSAPAVTLTAPCVAIDTANVIRLGDIDELDKWDVPERVKIICVQGRHPLEPPKPSRSEWLFDAVCQLCRSGVPDEVIFSILTDSKFGISKSVLEKGDRYALRQIERAKVSIDDPILFEMNQRHASVSLGGKFRVVTLKPDLMYPSQTVAEFSTKEDFCNLVDHPRVVTKNIKGGTVTIGRGKYFLNQERHERFDGVDFLPGGPKVIELEDSTGRICRNLNLFAGFTVEPKEGDCGLYLSHMRENICGGNDDVYEYVLNLMAYQVQHPEDPQRVSLSMRGVHGTGKGIFATEYGKLFGRHFFHITNPVHLTGKFNAHSAEAMFEFADEALNLGDPQIAAIMKTHISERTRMIERKGIDAFQARSFSTTWFSTNEEHPITIESTERRYFPLYVSSKHAKDKEYFLPIIAQMKNGGRAALLHFLLARNVTNFNAEDMPQTEELHRQKILSATPGDLVIIGFADEGHLPGAMTGFDGRSKKQDRPWLAKSQGVDSLFDAMRSRGGETLRRASDPILARILKSWGFKSHHLGTCAGWAAPPLGRLRAAIKAKYPGYVWEHPEIVEWGCVTTRMAERQRKAERDRNDTEAQEKAPF